MNFLLIHQIYQSQFIEALEQLYEAWKIEDAKQVEEDRHKGIIRCFSQLHLMYEDPINTFKKAELVSFNNGILGPPINNEKFFLIDDRYLKDTSRMLAFRGFKYLSDIMTTAPIIQIPEVFIFTDSENDGYEIIGWSQEDALSRLEKEGRAKFPILDGYSCWPAFPSCDIGNSSVYVGKGEPEYPELEETIIEDPY